MENKPENWPAMTPEEKRAWRLELYRNSGKNVKFVSKQAEKNFNTRVNRQIAVYNVEKPDRIPLNFTPGNLPLQMAGLENRTAYYEPEKAMEAAMKFNDKYASELENFSLPMSFSGEVMDILGYKLYAWPGGGLPNNAGGFQFREGEYMTADEYDDLIRDPSDFWLRKYLPRVFGSFVPFTRFAALLPTSSKLPVSTTWRCPSASSRSWICSRLSSRPATPSGNTARGSANIWAWALPGASPE